MKEVRAFTRRTERVIAERFGIVNPVTNAARLLQAGRENSPAWLDARTRTVGASEIGVLMMSDHPYQSVFSLWHVKAQGRGRHPQTSAQERGHLLEPGIARRFAEAHPDLVVGRPNGALWSDPDFPHLSCTPDFLTINADGLIVPLETKSDEGGDGWGWGDEEIPAHHWWQINQQAGIVAAPYSYIARWNTRGYRDYTVVFDDDRYVKAAHEARLFMDDVKAGREPEPDGHRASGQIIREVHPRPVYAGAPVRVPDEWGDELDELKASRKEIERQIDDLTNKIRALMGDSPVAFDLTGRVHTRTLQARKGFEVKPTTIDKLTTKAPKGTT